MNVTNIVKLPRDCCKTVREFQIKCLSFCCFVHQLIKSPTSVLIYVSILLMIRMIMTQIMMKTINNIYNDSRQLHRSSASNKFIQTSRFIQQLYLYLTHILSQYSSLYKELLQNIIQSLKNKNSFKKTE